MARQIAWSPEAIEDLEAIATFIERDSPYYARLRLATRGRVSEGASMNTLRSRPLVGSAARPKAEEERKPGREILAGIRAIKRGEHGRVINVPPVAAIREATGLSQSEFARLLGVSIRTLQEWEQGRRAPSGAARTLLLIASRNPRVLREVA
jgi:putative transcriptional regulator